MTGGVVFTVEPTEPSAAQQWPNMRDRAEALTSERPDDPARVALVLHECELLLIEIADLLAKVNNDRYEAERAYSRRKNTGLEKHAKTYMVTVARAIAENEADHEKRAWDIQRALFHHVEDVQKALQTKHYGLMNINKNMQSVMFTRGQQQ